MLVTANVPSSQILVTLMIYAIPSPRYVGSHKSHTVSQKTAFFTNFTLSCLNVDFPGLAHLVKLKQGLRKLWRDTRHPACKAATNCLWKTIRQMTHRRYLDGRKRLSSTEVTPRAIWPIEKFLKKRDGPKTPAAILGPLSLKLYSLEKSNATTDS
jgi:hypothetical protein